MSTSYDSFAERIWRTPTAFRDGLFDGKVVLVTGGATGIGLATALGFARLGARVAIGSRKPERLAAAAAFASSKGIDLFTWPVDIREPDQIATLFDHVVAAIGMPDILINNAGGQFPQSAIDYSVKGWNTVIHNNLNGTWYMMQQAARHWRDSGSRGSIVNIVAPTERGLPGVAHTVAARAGIVGLMNTVTVEWAPLGIRVNCVSPGLIDTSGLEVYPPEAHKEFSKANPLKRPGTACEVAEACIFLASPSAGFINGELMHVDGGYRQWGEVWTAGRPDYYKFEEVQ